MRPRPWVGLLLLFANACTAFTPAPSGTSSSTAFSIETVEPFFVTGRTAMQPDLRCPVTFVEGRFGPTRNNTYVLREIWEIRPIRGAPPACIELRSGRIAFDPSAPLVRSPTDHTHRQVTAAEGATIVTVVIVVVVVVGVVTWGSGGIGPLKPRSPIP